jgi:hypothetical protein
MPAPQQLIVLLFMAVTDLLVICYIPVNTTVNYQLPITNYPKDLSWGGCR